MRNEIYRFYDYYNNVIELSFQKDYFSPSPKHVWVVCQYKDKWLLTNHKERGLEFPGGKIELHEKPLEAAIREVKEETGGIVETIINIGQYKVNAKKEIVIKNIYFAQISHLQQQECYFETEGPVLLKDLPTNIQTSEKFSFIMKDDVLTYSLSRINFINNNNKV